MANLFQEGGALRKLVTTIDELRDVGLSNYISLPRIAAIGTQSSGKSSLVESIVGMDFLPRGGGVVTRRPLELRLVHLNAAEHPPETAWGVFDKVSDKKFTNFDEVRTEIERQTDEIAGSKKGIVDDPIILTIYATGAPDLTMIDLPGITRVPVKGSDQTEDIEKTTRDMTMRYAGDPRTIILAVIPANQDMSVSDALAIGRHADPKGHRTIGVVTKIDIMDAGTDAVKMLRGDEIPLKLGYVGVKMRTQQDIIDKKLVKQSLREEREWFENHPKYSKLPPSLFGMHNLTDKLTVVLFKHIRKHLPQIKQEISEKRRSIEERLSELGTGVPLDDAERHQVMWQLITDFSDMFKNTIKGKYDRKLQRYMSNLPDGQKDGTLAGGAKVRSIMNEFLMEMWDSDVSKELSDDDIERAIRSHEGDSLPGFPSPDTFEFLALPYLQRIQIPATECVHNVAGALDVLAQRMSQAVFRRFPGLQEHALEITQNIIQREKDSTRLIVEQQINSQVGYLFTNDDDYLIKHASMESMFSNKPEPPKPAAPQQPPPPPAEPGMFDKAAAGAASGAAYVKTGATSAYKGASSMVGGKAAQPRRQRYSGHYIGEIRRRLDAYFRLTIKNVRDVVPQAIGFYLVRSIQDKLQFELLQQINKAEKAAKLLGEPPHIMEERRALTQQLDVLKKAINVLTRDPALASMAFEAEEDDEPEPAAPAPAPKAAAQYGGYSQAPATAGGNLFAGAPQAASAAPPAAAPKPASPAGNLFGGGGGAPAAQAKTSASALFGAGAAAPKPAAPAGGLFGAQPKAPSKGLFD